MSPADGLPPTLEAAFELLRPLGAGAMGQVLLARDRTLDRVVAIKLLLWPERPEQRERFVREAAGLARVPHRNVVTIFDHGVADGVPYLVMEYVEGRPLDQGLEGDPLEVMLPLADALGALHQAGMVHRDFKPANVVVAADGRPVLLDFGLLRGGDQQDLTRTGHVVGTLAYMAPEVLFSSEYGPPVDWYAWGVTLYWLVMGKLPRTMDEVAAVLEGRVPAGLPAAMPEHPGLRAVLRRCLDPDPARRPNSRGEIESLLARADTGPRSGSRSGVHRTAPTGPSTSAPAPVTRGPPARAWSLALPGLGLLVWLGFHLGTGAPPPRPSPAPAGPTRALVIDHIEATSGATCYRLEGGGTYFVVPEGRFRSRLSKDPARPPPVETVALGSFLLSDHPVTVAEYQAFLTATGAAPPPRWPELREHPKDPVVGASRAEAAAFAAWCGGRLPRPREWERAAAVRLDERPLGHAVSEWVEDPEDPAASWTMGSARRDVAPEARPWLLHPGPPEGRAPTLGFRVLLEAPLGVGEAADRVRDVPAAALLEPLAPAPDGARRWRNRRDGASLLEIPGGTFPYRQARIGEPRPGGRAVHVGGFAIAETEVTGRRFSLFDRAVERPELPVWSASRGRTLLPVVQVNWQEAAAYCRWTGGRLPTQVEWTRAAGGLEGRDYPWGDEAPSPGRALFGTDTLEAKFKPFAYLKAVGSFPAGDTPEGLADMAGSLYEWTADAAPPTGPEARPERFIKGGNYMAGPEMLPVWRQRSWMEDDRSVGIGFRCVYQLPESNPPGEANPP